jgi:MULE transposase domain
LLQQIRLSREDIFKPDRKRPASAVSHCGCPFELCVKLHPKTGKWWVHNYVDVHNQSFAASDTTPFLRSHYSINEAQKFEIVSFQDSGVHNFQILDYIERRSGGYEYRGFQSKNMYKFSAEHDQSAMLADDADSIIKYFKERKKMNSDFYFNYEANDGHLTSLFWAAAQSIIDYSHFRDVVIFDSTYKLNRYNMIVVPFLGYNHHRRTIIFACGIISREDKNSYLWLLKSLMEAMYQIRPESIIINGDIAMREAIKSIL